MIFRTLIALLPPHLRLDVRICVATVRGHWARARYRYLQHKLHALRYGRRPLIVLSLPRHDAVGALDLLASVTALGMLIASSMEGPYKHGCRYISLTLGTHREPGYQYDVLTNVQRFCNDLESALTRIETVEIPACAALDAPTEFNAIGDAVSLSMPTVF